MNCRSCLHARRAGNKTMIGCCYWTAIYHGDKNIVTSALEEINEKENLGMDLDKSLPNREDISFLIDTLICEYATKPIFEGWVDLERPYCEKKKYGQMTNFCVVLDPERFCTFFAQFAELH